LRFKILRRTTFDREFTLFIVTTNFFLSLTHFKSLSIRFKIFIKTLCLNCLLIQKKLAIIIDFRKLNRAWLANKNEIFRRLVTYFGHNMIIMEPILTLVALNHERVDQLEIMRLLAVTVEIKESVIILV